jgi:hypothetical protein
MENNELFRKNAVERISSPEQLNDYIHVTSPAIWMTLVGIIVILAGMIVWGIVGRLNTVEVGAGVVSGGELTVYVSPNARTGIKEGMTMTVQGEETQVETISELTETVPNDMDPYVLEPCGLEVGGQAYVVSGKTSVPDGIYTVSIVVESIQPITFVTH